MKAWNLWCCSTWQSQVWRVGGFLPYWKVSLYGLVHAESLNSCKVLWVTCRWRRVLLWTGCGAWMHLRTGAQQVGMELQHHSFLQRNSFIVLHEFRILGWSHDQGWNREGAHGLNSYESRGWDRGVNLVLILEIMECGFFCTWVMKSKIPACYTNKQVIATEWLKKNVWGSIRFTESF